MGVISSSELAKLYKYEGLMPVRAVDIWQHLYEELYSDDNSLEPELRGALEIILNEGTLARRILKRLPDDGTRSDLKTLYAELCECLTDGRQLHESA